MTNYEMFSLASKQFRISNSQLETDLKRIKRERQADIRMHDTMKQRFKAKYSKLDLYIDNRGKDASDVRMYETHNPGFCYRRNGECRIPQAPSSNTQSLVYEDIHKLLFTHGELDIEKVMCLHLLTAHNTETLTPPPKLHGALSILAREQSPLERLIERSKKKKVDEFLMKQLPLYILDVKPKTPTDDANTIKTNRTKTLIRDGRLAARFIINDKIVRLVRTVLNALQCTNPEKTSDFLKLGADPVLINEMLQKRHIQEFMRMLNGHTLISSCESFHLTQPFKTTTEPLIVQTPTGHLESLLRQTRKNVLQMPMQSTWKSMYQESSDALDQQNKILPPDSEVNKYHKTDSGSILSHAITTNRSMTTNASNKKDSFINKDSSAFSASEQTTSRTLVGKSRPKSPGFRQSVPEDVEWRFDKEDSIATSPDLDRLDSLLTKDYEKSIMNEETELRNQYLDENRSVSIKELEDFKLLNKKTNRLEYATLASLLEKKARQANKRYSEQIMNPIKEESDEEENPQEEAPEIKPEYTKFSLQRSKCYACREKWRIPLPNPKTPFLKKYVIPTLNADSYNEIKTKSTHRLSLLIEQEMQKMKEDKKQFTQHNAFSHKMFNKTSSRILLANKPIDNTELDVLDLLRISQEIREKETRKKIKKFLNQPM